MNAGKRRRRDGDRRERVPPLEQIALAPFPSSALGAKNASEPRMGSASGRTARCERDEEGNSGGDPSAGDGDAHLVRFLPGAYEAPRLKRLLADSDILKIFHYGRFDIAVLLRWLGVRTAPVWCTKIASKLTRTYTDRHGLKDLCRQLLGVELSKEQQSSDWGAPVLSEQQLAYAAADVLHLHRLKAVLMDLLRREGRLELAEAAFRFLPYRAELDLLAGEEEDIFAH